MIYVNTCMENEEVKDIVRLEFEIIDDDEVCEKVIDRHIHIIKK